MPDPESSDSKITKSAKSAEMEKLLAEIGRLQKLVYIDELTGIYNRRGFKERAEAEFSMVSFTRVKNEKRSAVNIPLALVFIDLDNLKPINDSAGHNVGSEAIKSVVAVLKKNLRASDVFCRWGGDEFIAAIIGDSAAAVKVAEKIRKKIAGTEISGKNHAFKLSASLGVASSQTAADLEELINQADQAMYKAKQNGKNQVAVFDLN